jgi:hypothetical protein
LEAFGDINYGSACVIELKVPKELNDARVLPFSYVGSVIFSSQLDKDEFVAKLSGYSDIPDTNIQLRVDNKIFPVASSFSTASIIQDVSHNLDKKFYSDVDKLSGTVHALIFGLNRLKNLNKLGNFVRLSEVNESLLNPINFPKKVGQLLELFSDSEDSLFLLERLCNYLSSAEVDNGFDPIFFLNDLKINAYRDATEIQRKIIDGFCKHSLDILELRRDLTSLEDEVGKVIPRGILLFMLSPDSNKLDKLLLTYPRLGENVYLVASMLIGCLSGAAKLPSDIKSFSNDSALGISDLVFDMVMGRIGRYQCDSSFDENGFRKTRLIYKDRKIIDLKSNPDERLVLIFNAFRAAGQVVRFDNDGTLLVDFGDESCKVKIRIELISSFWRPSVLAVKASAVIPLKLFNKTTREILTSESNPTKGGVWVTVQPAGKSFVVELSMFSLIDNFINSEAQYICKEIFTKFQNMSNKIN